MKLRLLTPEGIETREAEGDKPPRIVGMGAVFYDGTASTEYRIFEDLIERIDPKAFDRSLREDDVFGLFNHDADRILGRKSSDTLRLETTSKGLAYEIWPGTTSVADDVYKWIERREVTGSSISFQVRSQEWEDRDDGTTVRTLTDVKLFDVGPVTFPAYAGTSVQARDGHRTDLVQYRDEMSRARRIAQINFLHARIRLACATSD